MRVSLVAFWDVCVMHIMTRYLLTQKHASSKGSLIFVYGSSEHLYGWLCFGCFGSLDRRSLLTQLYSRPAEVPLMKALGPEFLMRNSLGTIDEGPGEGILELESSPIIVQGVESADIRRFNWRQQLILESSYLLNAVLQLMRFVECLDRHDLPQLLFEAACALANVAYGTSEHTRVVISHGAVPLSFVR